MILGLCKKNIPRKWFVLGIFVLVVVRMVIAYSQRVFLMTDGSSIDDMLMVRAAMSLTQGNWLGDYGGVAIAKNMGFAFWLAGLHQFKIPYLMANAVLWIGACLFATQALRPKLTGNVSRLLVFGFLTFQPFSFAQFTMRAYRDTIFPAFCLLFFAGVVGLALRLPEKGVRGSVLASIGAGIGLAGACLLREDGIVLLLFAGCGLGLVLLFIILNKGLAHRGKKLLLSLLPFGLLAIGTLALSVGNLAHYGVFMTSDMTRGSFGGAYGAIVAVAEGEDGYTRYRPIKRETLEKLYREVPTLGLLEETLSSGTALNAFGDSKTGDYYGSFYFGLRLAADYAGVTPDGQAAQEFWRKVQQEIELAVEEGRLASVKPGKSTVPRFQWELAGPTAGKMGESFLAVFLFEDTSPVPQESMGPQEDVAKVAQYLRAPVQTGYVAGTDAPYFNPVQRLVFAFCQGLTWVYRIILWPLFGFALYRLGKSLAGWGKATWKGRAFSEELLYALLSLGLLLSFVLRLLVASYMEVAAFNLGIYVMYFAGGIPALLLFCILPVTTPEESQRASTDSPMDK